MNIFLVQIIWISFLLFSCNNSSPSPSSEVSPAIGTASNNDQVVVTGTLSIDPQSNEVNDSFTFSNQEVKATDDSGKTISKTLAGQDGSYVLTIPGQLATGGSIPSGKTGLSLNSGLIIESIVTETKNKSVLGIRTPVTDINSTLISLGNQPLEKITAIRGQVTLDGAKDHTGIVVYIPGTSYSARTDSSGNFLMTFLNAASYELSFEKDGYLPRKLENIEVKESETSLVENIILKLSGGTSNFSVKQVGTEGLSQSKVVEFLIQAGDADRFKGGLEDEVPNLAYGSVPELFRYEFSEDGTYALKLIFANADGFESVVTRNIIVDTTPPNSQGVLLADRTTLSTTHTNERVVITYHPTCEDIKKTAIMQENKIPRETDFIWDCLTTPTDNDFHFLIPGNSSSFAYQIWVMDAVGNISKTSQSGSIVFDNLSPNPPSITLTDQTNGSNTGTDITTINITFNSCEDTAKVLFSESQTSVPQPHQFTQECSTVSEAYSYTFGNNIAGEKTVVAWAIDHAGNIGPISGTASIILDQTPPIPVTFSLVDGTEETTGYSNNLNVNVVIPSCGDSTHVLISETQTTKPSELNNLWQTCIVSGLQTTLNGEGTRTAYIWTKDIGGNVSDTSLSTSITVDTTPPDTSSFTVNIFDSTSTSQSATNSQTISYTFSPCNQDATKIYISESPTPPNSNDFTIACNGGSASGNYTFTNGTNESKNIYFWTKDIAGNISSNYQMRSILLDTIEPSATSGLTLKDTDTGNTNYTNSQTLDYLLSTCPVGHLLLLRQDQNTPPAEDDSDWSPCTTSSSWSNLVTSGTGLKTVYAWIKDEAGNISSTAADSSITWDSSSPSNPTVTSHTSPLYVTTASINLSGTAESDSKIIILGASATVETTTDGSGNWSASINLNDNEAHSIQITATDLPGNVSTITNFTVYHDSIAPTINNSALDIRDNQVVISWDTNESSQTYLEWGTTLSYGNIVNPGGYSTSHTQTVTSLSENSIYYFKISAIDQAGNTSNGNDEIGSFKTYILKTGILAGDETWNVTDTSYLISGDVTVPTGNTLNIQPGVTIRFDANKKIRVEGTFIAQGTSGNEINFIPQSNAASSGYWKSIDFVSGSTGTTIDGSENYVSGSIIEYANLIGAGSLESPIRAYGITLLLNHINISQVGNSYYAILGDSASFIYLKHSSISSASAGGVDLNLSSVVVSSCHFEYINQYAVYADNMRSNIITRVENSTFDNMSSKFLYFASGVGGRASVTNNIFNASSSVATVIDGKEVSTIENNIFLGGRYAVNLSYTTFGETISISQNIFKSVALPINIKNWKSSTVNILSNHFLNSGFYSNKGAIAFDAWGTSSTYTGTYNINNNLFQGYANNSSYKLIDFTLNSYMTYILNGNNFIENSNTIAMNNNRLSGAGDIDATVNWWGTVTPSEIASQIYDNSDDSNLSSINTSTPLSTLGTSAPISYPLNISLTDNGSGSVLITWDDNLESDLSGYKLYYDFDNTYPYDGNGATQGASGIDVGNQTSYTLTNLPAGTIYIYVTSYDVTADGISDQFEGSESWYSTPVSISISP